MKHQNSFSFFCCYCEEPRKKDRNFRQRKIDPSQIPNIYKIDTNSNYSEKIEPSPKANETKIELENDVNVINNINNEDNINKINNENNIMENAKSINSYHTMNYKNKKENIIKKEDYNSHRNIQKNFLQSDINSFLEKKAKNNLNIENISGLFKNNEKDKDNSTNIINNQQKNTEEKKENKIGEVNNNNSINNNTNNIIINNKNTNNNGNNIININDIYSNTNNINSNNNSNNSHNNNDINKSNKNSNNINNNDTKINNKDTIKNLTEKNNINIKNEEIKTCINNKMNNIYSNQSFIKMNEKENTISQTIRRINKFEFEDNISNEQLLWKNKNTNIITNQINTNINLINKNNIIDENNNNNNILDKTIQNEQTKNEIIEKDTNPINKINIDNDITCEKEKEELTPVKTALDNGELFNKIKKENKTIQQKGNSKFSVNNNDNNSFNSAFELKANINKIKLNLINKNIIQNENAQNPKEITENKELIENQDLNEINNTETQREIIDKTDVYDSQSLSQKENNNSNIMIKEGINMKLNYLTEFYPTATNNEGKKENDLKKSKSQKESVSEEIEDEVGSIDEFNNSNDNRSELTSYIFSSVRPTESNKSSVSSVYGRSDSQDLTSNYNEIMSNKGMKIFPMDMNNINNKEIEIRMDSLNRNTKNYFISMKMNQIKKVKEKIADREKTINNNYNLIELYKNKIEKMEEEKRQYERWVEKEEEENENLLHLLNFLIECK